MNQNRRSDDPIPRRRRDDTAYSNLSVEQKILVNTEMISQTTEMMRKDYTKIIYALLGIIAASLGLKFAGTPWYIDVTIYLSLFSGVFVLGVTVSFMRELATLQKILRLVFSSFLLFNGAVQTFIYRPGTQIAPDWYTPVIEGYMILLAVILIVSTLRLRPRNHTYNDYDTGNKNDKEN